jgi:hypothetical protein
VPDTEEAITSTALVSMHDRQNRLTSLLHHLTVDPDAPHQELPMAGSLPALRVEEPPQVDNASVGSSGDRARPELQRQFLRNLNTVPPVEAARGGWLFARLFIIAGVAAAVVGSGIVLLPSARKAGNETVQAESPPPPVAASMLGHDSLPQENTEPPVAPNVLSTTGVPSPRVHENPPQENKENTEPAVSAKVQSAAGVLALTHNSLPQGDTEPSFAANVQSATGAPPRVYDNPAQDTKPPSRAAGTSPDQAPKPQLSQSVGTSLMADADEIAALVKRGKDFVANGDLVSARLLLLRAAEAGSAEAALALGETFGALVFQHLHVIGIEPDAASAQKWYQRAAELGSAAASQRLAKPDRAFR